MHWETKVGRKPNESATVTKAMAQEMRQLYHKHGWSERAVAEHFNVNIGRVSEALHGKR
jgi:hypothetical protein